MAEPSSESSPVLTRLRALGSRLVDAADDPLSHISTFFFLTNFVISGYILSAYLLPLLGCDFGPEPFTWWPLDLVGAVLFGFNGWTGWTKRRVALGEKDREAEGRKWSEFAEEMRG